MRVLDTRRRPLLSLRLSVTDRCNLRCAYCMPEPNYLWLPRSDLLTFEEIDRLAGVFASLGVEKLRLTGGEPLLRHELPKLVSLLCAEHRFSDLALTTNGLLLRKYLGELERAGLRRVTVSLDTLRPERFQELSRSDQHAEVLRAIEAASTSGLSPLKLDTVLIRGVNDDETLELLRYARSVGAELRFIEYMDVGGATGWQPHKVVSRREILSQVEAAFGAVEPLVAHDSAPAERFKLPDGTTFGIIASMTAPFCAGCDRARLTADGTLFLCLYAREGLNLLSPLRRGATDAELTELIFRAWTARTAQGAEDRGSLADRRPLAGPGELRLDPRLEMHTRGG